MKRIAVFASGNGSNLQAVIDACEKKAIAGSVCLVCYNRKDAYARVRAQQYAIPVVYLDKTAFETSDEMDAFVIKELEQHKIDLIVLAGYLLKIGPRITAAYCNRIINTHPALIPSFCGKGYYGHHVHEAVLNYGVKLSGCTIHFVDEGMDTGPIILQQAVPVYANDTVQTLSERVLTVEHQLLPKAVALFCEDRLQVHGRKVMINELEDVQ